MKQPVLVYGIIAVTSIISIIGFSNKAFFEKNMFSIRAVIKDKEFYRLFMSQFLHVNWAHLLFNMFSFYSFGVLLEERFGVKILLVIYLYGALCGDLVALAIKRKNPGYAAVGASGAVCAVIFASIFLLPGGSVYVMMIPVPIPSWIYALVFMAVSLYGMGRGNSMIGHEAHVGGALAGIAWAVVFDPSVLARDYILLAALTVPVVILLVYYVRRA